MTLQQIYECRTLQPLLELWEDKTLSDDLRLAVAYQYDRLKAHREAEEKAKFDKNEQVEFKNPNNAEII